LKFNYKLLTIHLQGTYFEHVLKKLRRQPCGGSPAAAALRRQPCGGSPAAAALRPCGGSPVAALYCGDGCCRPLRRWPCGSGPKAAVLRRRLAPYKRVILDLNKFKLVSMHFDKKIQKVPL
jgi:hypothetical protein